MKKLIFPIIALMLLAFVSVDSKLTDEERLFAVKQLNTTQDHLQKVVTGLSAAQLNFKPDENAWSIAECVEHLAISENTFSSMVEGLLEAPADPSKKGETQMSDKEILAFIVDRSTKVKTQKPFEPSGKFGSHEATLSNFMSLRKDNIEFIKLTEDDLRSRYTTFPFGTIDAYQVILFMSGHTERHVLQMEEVMAHANFPAQ